MRQNLNAAKNEKSPVEQYSTTRERERERRSKRVRERERRRKTERERRGTKRFMINERCLTMSKTTRWKIVIIQLNWIERARACLCDHLFVHFHFNIDLLVWASVAKPTSHTGRIYRTAADHRRPFLRETGHCWRLYHFFFFFWLSSPLPGAH